MKIPEFRQPSTVAMINIVGGLVAVYLGIALIGTVTRNYELKQQIADTRTEIVKLENDTTELGYRVQYYKTDSFKEREARAKLGLQAPGENVIILPRREGRYEIVPEEQPKERRSNFRQWMDFLSGRS